MDLAAELHAFPTPTETTPTTSTSPSDPTAAPALVPEAPPAALDLEQELATVMAGFGSFWGKVRAQSAAVLETAEKQIGTARMEFDSARKELTPLMEKARANLDTFGETTKAELMRLSEAGNSTSGVMIGADGTPIIMDDYVKVDKGKGVDRSGEGGEGEEGSDVNPAAAAAAFFAKVQTQLAANTNVQELSKGLSSLQSSVSTNLSHLPTSLQTNLTQLQSQFSHLDSQKVAEDYLHKGENWLSEFSNEVSRLAKDAVKVFPPSERSNPKRDERLRQAEQVSVGRRAMLLQRLRSDSSILLVDPARPLQLGDAPLPTSDPTVPTTSPSDTREAFSIFLQTIEDAGGFEGEHWTAQIAKELDVAGGNAEQGLSASLAKLVPTTLTAEAFWSRYFFRVSQIDADEQRRKAVIEVAAGEDEDFSWDADEDTPSVVTPSSPLPSTAALPDPSTPKQVVEKPTSTAPTSPRASSDGTSSYDVVGNQSGNASAAEVSEEAKKGSDGDDSDWE